MALMLRCPSGAGGERRRAHGRALQESLVTICVPILMVTIPSLLAGCSNQGQSEQSAESKRVGSASVPLDVVKEPSQAATESVLRFVLAELKFGMYEHEVLEHIGIGSLTTEGAHIYPLPWAMDARLEFDADSKLVSVWLVRGGELRYVLSGFEDVQRPPKKR